MGGPIVKLPLITWLFTIPFNFGYVHITKSFMIHEMYGCPMYDTEGNKRHICIRDNLLNCRQPHQHIYLKEKK